MTVVPGAAALEADCDRVGEVQEVGLADAVVATARQPMAVDELVQGPVMPEGEA